MKVEHAICLRDYVQEVINKESQERDDVTLKRGHEYTVSLPHDDDGTRTVFTKYWFRTPGDLWGGAR